ncbi:MAG: DUF3365 domain-containing protein, partial [Cyanobacteria bacterium J06641_5]
SRSPGERLFYIARPIQIKNESCLACHSVPERAPKSLVDLYGDKGGFNWQLNEIVGSQVIEIPASTLNQKVWQSLLVTLGIFISVFAFAIFLVNLWLKRYVVRPINRMSIAAEAVSLGDTQAEFTVRSEDEVGKLAEAFNRMRLSLDLAMKRLQKRGSGGNSRANRSS